MKYVDFKSSTCCFLGHRKIDVNDDLLNKLKDIIEDLIIDKKVEIFLFGSKSQFDRLCLEIVTGLKEKYSHIKRIYVRAEFPYIDEDYRVYLLKNYDDTYYPERIMNAGRAVYVERNCEMIDSSNFCVIYYDENYLPTRRKNSKKDLVDYQPKSGTKIAYDYAKRCGVKIFNILEIVK